VTSRIVPRLGSTFVAGMIVVVFVVVSFTDRGTLAYFIPNQRLLGYGGATAATLLGGQWWRIATSQFLHVYLLHALFNSAAILLVGSQLEERIGMGRLLIVAFVCGTIGQVIAVTIAPEVVATGASQAALGLAGALIVLAFPSRSPRALLPALAYVVAQVVLDLLSHHLKLPHVASLAAGVLCGSALRYVSDARPRPDAGWVS
jgi:membrane associated rhomboid family serine protease